MWLKPHAVKDAQGTITDSVKGQTSIEKSIYTAPVCVHETEEHHNHIMTVACFNLFFTAALHFSPLFPSCLQG